MSSAWARAHPVHRRAICAASGADEGVVQGILATAERPPGSPLTGRGRGAPAAPPGRRRPRRRPRPPCRLLLRASGAPWGGAAPPQLPRGQRRQLRWLCCWATVTGDAQSKCARAGPPSFFGDSPCRRPPRRRPAPAWGPGPIARLAHSRIHTHSADRIHPFTRRFRANWASLQGLPQRQWRPECPPGSCNALQALWRVRVRSATRWGKSAPPPNMPCSSSWRPAAPPLSRLCCGELW